MKNVTQPLAESTASKHLKTIKAVFGSGHSESSRIMGLERVVLLLLCVSMYATPGLWVRHIGGLWGRKRRKDGVELYALVKVAMAAAILFGGYWNAPFTPYLCYYLLADLFISLGGYLFLRRFWQNPYSWNRSLILLIINFVEYTLWFACLYLSGHYLKCGSDLVTSAGDAWYFSIVTAATVGYGDISPVSGIGRTLVAVEIGASMFFLATVVAYFVSNMAGEETDKVQPATSEGAAPNNNSTDTNTPTSSSDGRSVEDTICNIQNI